MKTRISGTTKRNIEIFSFTDAVQDVRSFSCLYTTCTVSRLKSYFHLCTKVESIIINATVYIYTVSSQ